MRTRPSLRWSSFLSLGVAVAILVAACGSSGTPAPTTPGGSGPAPTSGGQTEPPTSLEPGGSNDLGGPDFAAAASGLGQLDSYEFSVESQTIDTADSRNSEISLISGIVINRPTAASRTEQTTKDGDGNVTNYSGIIVIGDRVWSSDDGETWEELPAALAPAMVQVFQAYRPEQLFGILFLPAVAGFGAQGQEQKNGVDTDHFRGDESINSLLSAFAGVDGSWEADVWLARNGGFLVSSRAHGTSTDETFDLAVDILKVNDPSNRVDPPTR